MIWVGDADAEIWGNGASFDPVLWGSAYDAMHHPRPWRFWNERCFRTVKALYPHVPVPPRSGTHHNALADALHQALHLMAMVPGL